jgi:short-subunit dehydrogenase
MRHKIVIIGATSAIAEQCARIWLSASPKTLHLLGRDLARTERVAQDLRVRSPQSSVTVHKLDFRDPARIQWWVDSLCNEGVPDVVLIAHGALPDQKQCQQNLTIAQQILELNAISPVLFAEAFVNHMESAGRGKLGIISSVAGDRGRKSNYVYGSSKGLVTRFAQGLQHRLVGSGVSVTLVKPGPTDTPMTADLKNKGIKLADVGAVARGIVRGIDSGQATVYAPMKWRLIMLAIRHLPNFFFNKLDI